jgi:hypothetical protein
MTNHYEEAERLLHLAGDNNHLDNEVTRLGALTGEPPLLVRDRISALLIATAHVHALLIGKGSEAIVNWEQRSVFVGDNEVNSTKPARRTITRKSKGDDQPVI